MTKKQITMQPTSSSSSPYPIVSPRPLPSLFNILNFLCKKISRNLISRQLQQSNRLADIRLFPVSRPSHFQRKRSLRPIHCRSKMRLRTRHLYNPSFQFTIIERQRNPPPFAIQFLNSSMSYHRYHALSIQKFKNLNFLCFRY